MAGQPRTRPRATGRSSRLLRLACFAAAAGALAHGAPAAAAVPRPVVGSVLRVTGSGGAFATVRLTRPLTRPLDGDVTAVGDPGRVALLVVSEAKLTTDPRYLLLDRLPIRAGGTWSASMHGTGGKDGAVVLPAGNYRVYLLSARRATISIRLPGQPARATSLTTRVRVGHRITTLPAQQVGGQYRPVSETNETYTFRRPGIAFTAGVLDYSALHSYTIGGCLYHGTPPPGESVAQICAGGTSFGQGSGYVVPTVTPGRVTGGLIVSPIQARTVTFGLYYQFAGVLRDVHQYNVWVELEP